MSLHAAITHRTTYRYDRPILLGPHSVRLRPAPHCRTPILSYAQHITPNEHFINWQQDPYGNFIARLVFQELTDSFEVTVDLVAQMNAINPFDFFLEDDAEHVPFKYEPSLKHDLAPYLVAGGFSPRLDALVTAAPTERLRTVDFLVAVNQLVYDRVDYVIRMEPGVQTPEETLELGRGSCRDSAWLMVQLLRRLGYAARFVSGYLIQLKADEKALDGPSGAESDFTDLHAWCEVYAPGAGWIGLDPTSGLFAGEGHIPLAATPSPSSAAAITGAHEKAEVSFDFDMAVRRIYEAPRVTKPYSDAQWQAIDAAGRQIDEKLFAGDVRLTMGGEPTFVSIDDFDADEWNLDAVGPTKRHFADDLIRRLMKRFAPAGVLQHGDGKWYPGESLPRWAFSLIWRGDGAPLWQEPELLAKEGDGEAPNQDLGQAEARRFAETLCETLEFEPEFAQAAYEDPAEYLFRERKLAPDIDPRDNRLENPEDRDRLARVFERGLTKPAAYVIPIQLAQAKAGRRRAFRWRSEKWRTRRGGLFLLPGDSAAGFRLPLQSLAAIRAEDAETPIPLDPFAARGALPAITPQLQRRVGRQGLGPEDPDWIETGDEARASAGEGAQLGGAPGPRTAFTIEPRDGKLCVFLPPVGSADEYVDLVNAIEEAAGETNMPVRIEGYGPPPDPRLNVIKVTPDPGVIEVNIHPATSWTEQAEITTVLYEEARQARLTASKFTVDGRQVGSGGGNHVVLGGPSAADSPFLRRPDLLASLIRYWQNHPSLSYLFSGQFIGPTSQAPRIDEARQDTLYEMDLALGQIPDREAGAPPSWLVDRVFRHLLTDVTGNTHRAEICIDKLYSPDGPTGRLGLVEFRAFEMPPHAQMSLAQQLVLRGLVAWFWDQPYKAPLSSFGVALHDKFMLPEFVWMDFKAVLHELGEALGITFDPQWFAPQFEFRFPNLGSVQYQDVNVELRAALEPWHVLGEETAGGGVARFVDSSLERVQVKVSGLVGERYKVACNGVALPLRAVDDAGGFVSGVRYRSWWPSSCLHPTIPPHAPLIFDVVDTHNQRSVGGCTYYSEHPGGRNSEDRPVNALEAEGRRLARFSPMGHTPGPFQLRDPVLTPNSQYTLDMRRN